MTVLSRALTAETPEERAKDIIKTVRAFWDNNDKTPDALIDAMVREFYLNERTIYIDAARYGPRPSQSPAPTGDTIPQAGKTAGATAPAHPESPRMPSQPGSGGTPDKTDTSGSKPPAPNGPLPGVAPDKDKDALIARLQSYNSSLRLPPEAFKRLSDVGVGKYPESTTDRIACLRSLPLDRLRYLVEGK